MVACRMGAELKIQESGQSDFSGFEKCDGGWVRSSYSSFIPSFACGVLGDCGIFISSLQNRVDNTTCLNQSVVEKINYF